MFERLLIIMFKLILVLVGYCFKLLIIFIVLGKIIISINIIVLV